MVAEATEYAYLKLKAIRLANSASQEVFAALKKCYERDINSVRTFATINNGFDLIYYLEARNAISEDVVTPLNHIAVKLENEDFLREIVEYGQALVNRNSRRDFVSTRPPSRLDLAKKQEACNLIIESTSHKWRALGRTLNISEGILEEMGCRSMPDSRARMREVLDIFSRTVDPKFWRIEICSALEDIRRKDLKREVETIFS